MVRIARAKAMTNYGRLTARRRDVGRRYARRRPLRRSPANARASESSAPGRSGSGAWDWPAIGDWLAGVATLAAVASWGLLASLLAG